MAQQQQQQQQQHLQRPQAASRRRSDSGVRPQPLASTTSARPYATRSNVPADPPAAAAPHSGRASSASPLQLYDNDNDESDAVRPAEAGWSTIRRASHTGLHNMTTAASIQHDEYIASQAAAQKPAIPAGSGSSKVDEYLKRRNKLKDKSESFSRLVGGKRANPPALISAAPSMELTGSGAATTSLSIAAEPVTTYSFENSSQDESSRSESEAGDDFSVVEDEDEEGLEWSVKACVISAVDFPASVVPNLPFSPVLKLGLVRLRSSEENPQGEAGTVSNAEAQRSCTEMASIIERDGLAAVPKSRIRCTTPKVLSKRDNGSVEFHEEMRWDGVKHPQQMALALELSSRAVMAPANIRESPPAQKVGPFQFPTTPHASIGHGQTPLKNNPGSTDSRASGLGALFQKIRKTDSTEQEMEEANAAAAVAKLLVQDDGSNTTDIQATLSGPLFDNKPPNLKAIAGNQSEVDVKLRLRRKRRRKTKMTEELRLGSKVVPLSQLALEKAMNGNQAARIEQWFELETPSISPNISSMGTSPSTSTATRNPSVLVEISFSAPLILDESEDDMDYEPSGATSKASYSKRASLKIRSQLKQEIKPEEAKIEEPMLEPGIIDFVCVVGARDIGDQKADDGARGWVNSTPECCILEQFPSDDKFHAKNGRPAVLPGKVEWFCFPEGCRLWRGLTPPNYDELNLKRFSASSPAQVATSFASFDACLGCTTSFSWFVIASNSDEYGSESKKTYGTVIRFYVPAPVGIDPTQDDFGQGAMGSSTPKGGDQSEAKRLWVPLGICMTSSMPIVGTMEVILLRLCENLSAGGAVAGAMSPDMTLIHKSLASLIVHFQKPIPGAVSCSFPFLGGERLQIGLPPRKGLPPLPHGNAIASVCRLLGADGLNYLLAAFLTECKILLHSDDVANLCMVAEVITSLLYPFQWSLPYVPVLPAEMMEFLEAPLSYLLGVPSCNMQHVDPVVLEDIVVVDLDRDFSSDFEGRRSGLKTKSPVPLPAAVASNISKAVYRLIRAEEEKEVSMGSTNFPGMRSFPRLEPESLPEREFRLAVAIEVCGLIRGYDECLVFSSSQPVFNVDKFLQIAPAIFEEQRGPAPTPGQPTARQMISPRSRRFVSILVCCQHFHQFLEVLDAESLAFFHRIMRSLETKSARKDTSLAGRLLSLDTDKTLTELSKALQNLEDKIPMYRVKSYEADWATIDEETTRQDGSTDSPFPSSLLQQIVVDSKSEKKEPGSEGVKSVSLEYLVALEKNPWRYNQIFDIKLFSANRESLLPAVEKVKLREAIGDRRYRTWKSNLGFDKLEHDESSVFSEDSKGFPTAFDLKSLLTTATDDLTSLSSDGGSSFDAAEELAAIERDRDILRRCLESAVVNSTVDENLVLEAEEALQNRLTQKFLLEILSSRSRLGSEKKGDTATNLSRRKSLGSGGSKLNSRTFQILIRLAFTMLDSCMETKNFETAYALLKVTAGLYKTEVSDKDGESEVSVVYLTERIGLHPVFASLDVWDQAKAVHKNRNQLNAQAKSEGEQLDENHDEYEAVVATLYEMNGYGIPAEELARFASHMCKQHGWYNSERGQTLLMLAKRVCLRRDQGHAASTPSTMSDLALMSPSPTKRKPTPSDRASKANSRKIFPAAEDFDWVETAWCHPAAQSSRRANSSDATKRSGPQDLLGRFDGKESGGYMRRAAVTSMAYLGSSVVVTGGLDGGVFMARKVKTGSGAKSLSDSENFGVRGVHLDWGSSGSRYSVGSTSSTLDGEYGVGAVTCLATTRSSLSSVPAETCTKDVVDALEDEDILEAMEGCRVVAGTTCGDLRVWSVKDVFKAVFYASSGGDANSSVGIGQRAAAGSSTASRRRSGTEFAAGSSLTRLKFSLRGRALSGHRGGVSCIDVHSTFYRPDSIVSGGADGLIKLWSLRAPGTSSGGRRPSVEGGKLLTTGAAESLTPRSKAAKSGDALSILSGHGGRIICVKTAWHGDRLLSGGADRTVRLWDLAASGGKCLNCLTGHFGWVTSVQYWGPNTIISASTDRSLALWDARVRNSPLFTLRHHHAPVSDILVGPRTDPVMVSAASDGSIAAWDFRHLTGMNDMASPSSGSSAAKSEVVRNPAGKLYLHNLNRKNQAFGPVHLSRGVSSQRKTALCLGNDAVIREWDYQTGDILNEHETGHCDSISSFASLGGDKVLDTQLESAGPETATATLTASWDGTVRMRTLMRKES